MRNTKTQKIPKELNILNMCELCLILYFKLLKLMFKFVEL